MVGAVAEPVGGGHIGLELPRLARERYQLELGREVVGHDEVAAVEPHHGVAALDGGGEFGDLAAALHEGEAAVHERGRVGLSLPRHHNARWRGCETEPRGEFDDAGGGAIGGEAPEGVVCGHIEESVGSEGDSLGPREAGVEDLDGSGSVAAAGRVWRLEERCRRRGIFGCVAAARAVQRVCATGSVGILRGVCATGSVGILRDVCAWRPLRARIGAGSGLEQEAGEHGGEGQLLHGEAFVGWMSRSLCTIDTATSISGAKGADLSP